jgi:3-deoxy-D-manno-octulosonic-acid transferase/heptosyltransferase-1
MKDEPSSILIIKLSAIGDVVHTLPLLSVLRGNYPRARIDWLVEEEASMVIEGHPAVNRVLISRRKSWFRRFMKGGEYSKVVPEIRAFLKELRICRYDLVIDLQGLFKSGVLTGLARGKRKIGMEGAREGGRFFLNERPVPVDYDQHAIDRYLKMADYLKCRHISWRGGIPISKAHEKLVNEYVSPAEAGQRPIIAINPMARWKTKLWDPDRFASLADRIHDDLSHEVVFTGSNGDRKEIECVINKMKSRPLNLAGRTSLKEVAHLYTRCKALITTDTGPMHIAAAMGCPVVALFGPTAPWRTGPYGQRHEVIRADIECSPCFKKSCSHIKCMEEIEVDQVFEAVRNLVTQT